MSSRTARLAAGALLSFLAMATSQAQTVKMATSAGDILIELDAARAPKTVENFVHYVKSGHYDGTVFHRVIDGFMIQGGGFGPDMNEKPTARPAIPLESRNGLANKRGTIAMARTPDPNSARAQFFINVADNAFLDAANSRDGNGYAVFGRVTQGMDVVDRIKSVKTGRRGPHGDVPVEPVLIKQVTLEK